MSEDVARLQEGIDAARKAFGTEREGLEDMLARDFVSGVDAADTLLSSPMNTALTTRASFFASGPVISVSCATPSPAIGRTAVLKSLRR